jgi:hypothetical protein
MEPDITQEETPMAQITIQPTPTGFFIPPLVQGDAEYKGHGPVTYLRVDLQVRNSKEVWAQVYMRARETRQDWTTAEGTAEFMIGSSAKPIMDILTSRVQDHQYTDTDHDVDVFSFPASGPVSRIEYVGDTAGKEAGIRTGCQVFFHPMRLLVAD